MPVVLASGALAQMLFKQEMMSMLKDFQKMCIFLRPMPHVLLFTCIFQALRNESFAGSLQDRRAPIALERYMAHIESGILIHGPLLGWATIMGGTNSRCSAPTTSRQSTSCRDAPGSPGMRTPGDSMVLDHTSKSSSSGMGPPNLIKLANGSSEPH